MKLPLDFGQQRGRKNMEETRQTTPEVGSLLCKGCVLQFDCGSTPVGKDTATIDPSCQNFDFVNVALRNLEQVLVQQHQVRTFTCF